MRAKDLKAGLVVAVNASLMGTMELGDQNACRGIVLGRDGFTGPAQRVWTGNPWSGFSPTGDKKGWVSHQAGYAVAAEEDEIINNTNDELVATGRKVWVPRAYPGIRILGPWAEHVVLLEGRQRSERRAEEARQALQLLADEANTRLEKLGYSRLVKSTRTTSINTKILVELIGRIPLPELVGEAR